MTILHRLTIQPGGHSVPIAPGQTLLEAAHQGGISMRSACRNGTCRECIAQVLAGRVSHCIEWPGLSADEKVAGWVLPCVAVAEGGVTLLQTRIERVQGPAHDDFGGEPIR